jgi:hypothetical protein
MSQPKVVMGMEDDVDQFSTLISNMSKETL